MDEMLKLLDDFQMTEVSDSDYTYNGQVVPRVTKIISKCIHSDGLMYWANSLGFKHQSYSKTLNAAANIGTECHENIEAFIESNDHVEPSEGISYQGLNAYRSFLKWFNDVKTLAWELEVIYHEKTLVCKYFGGTLDGLYKINGKYYLVDYKTSNHITYNYCLQLSAYRYMLRTELGLEVDGCIILQLSKSSISYNEYVLNFSNPDHLKFMNDCERAFLSLVYAYYNIYHIEDCYKHLQWEVI